MANEAPPYAGSGKIIDEVFYAADAVPDEDGDDKILDANVTTPEVSDKKGMTTAAPRASPLNQPPSPTPWPSQAETQVLPTLSSTLNCAPRTPSMGG